MVDMQGAAAHRLPQPISASRSEPITGLRLRRSSCKADVVLAKLHEAIMDVVPKEQIPTQQILSCGVEHESTPRFREIFLSLSKPRLPQLGLSERRPLWALHKQMQGDLPRSWSRNIVTSLIDGILKTAHSARTDGTVLLVVYDHLWNTSSRPISLEMGTRVKFAAGLMVSPASKTYLPISSTSVPLLVFS
nr:hypothetical protein CFP56_69355 [Quercus suber]